MVSIDTNILLYSLNRDCAEYAPASQFIQDLSQRTDVLICDLVLIELYLLLRNPSVLRRPLHSRQAAEICSSFRSNPRWRVVESAPIMQKVWQAAMARSFPRRRIIDARLAYTLLHHGVSDFATRNTRDFSGFGFERVFDPLS
ncbi:MAG: PIN domain-containing protein [Deltaproteobacteria bacterium]|nr:PIN domain-containing protein [Deltaproteobacteria bacterium]